MTTMIVKNGEWVCVRCGGQLGARAVAGPPQDGYREWAVQLPVKCVDRRECMQRCSRMLDEIDEDAV